MPCYTIVTVSLELKDADLDLMSRALEAVGERVYGRTQSAITWATGSYNRNTGMITTQEEAVGKLVKRAYSAEVVKSQAKRFGWKLKETSAFTYEITKG